MPQDANKPPSADPNAPVQSARKRVRSALEAAGWELEAREDGPSRFDFLAHRRDRSLAIVIGGASGRARREILRGKLADCILKAKAAAEPMGAAPVALICAPAISDKLAAELAAYVAEVAPGIGWGLLDERGRFDLHGEVLADLVSPESSSRPAPPSAPPVAPANPFSDLGQWLLKVMLARDVPAELLGAPRGEVRSASALAELAGVSSASVSRILKALEADDYLVRGAHELRLVRIEALLQAWRRSAQRPLEQWLVRPSLPGGDPLDHVHSALARRARSHASPVGPEGARMCLGHFAASRALGLGFVRGAPLHLYCEAPLPALFEQLDLVAVEHPKEAEWIVVRPAFPESVFRGCVERNGVPVADALQCWIDVSFHAARGEEQASEIAARIWSERWSH